MKKSLLIVMSLATLMIGAAAQAQSMTAMPTGVPEASPFKFEFHGIVGASMYVQTTPDFLLNGQGPLLLKSQNNAYTTGFDIRQTRLGFSVSGPTVFDGATPKAVVEADFFGLNGAGAYGEVSTLSRLRLAYAELNWGDTWLRAGQDWQLLWANSPATLGHLAYSPVWFAGLVGWREPGFGIFHKMATGESANLEGALQMSKSDWANPAGFGLSSSNDQDVDAGQLSGIPAVEARIKWTSGNTLLYVAGHWNRVNGANQPAQVYTKAGDSLSLAALNWDVIAVKLGAKCVLSNLTLQGEIYTGKNTAPLLGEESVFSYTANDVHEAGGWFQAGYNFTPEFSLWGLYGTTRSDVNDVTAAGGGAFMNAVVGGMLQYKSGAYGVGPEIYAVQTNSTFAAGADAPDGVMDAMQYMLSGMYTF